MSGGLVYNRDVLLDPARHDFTKKAAVIEDNPDEVIDKKTTKDTPVYFWYLKTSSDTVKTTPPYTQSFSRMRDDIGPETVINVEDGRTEVPEQHFKDKDGKYRGELSSNFPLLPFIFLSFSFSTTEGGEKEELSSRP